MIIGNLNVNSLSIKFAQLQEIVLKYEDILILTETSLRLMVSQYLIDRRGTETEVVL